MTSRRDFLFGIAALPPVMLWRPIALIEREVFRGINVQRKAADLNPLAWDDALCLTAREHSRRMIESGYFGHVDPEMGDLQTRLNAAGIAWARCGENVFRETHFPNPAALAVVAWMYSEGHRKNLLTPEYKLTGVGAALGPNEMVTVTQQFLVRAPNGMRRRLP